MVKNLLICTDLDRTLIPNGKPPESTDARALFAHFVSDPCITLAYVTGRDHKLVQNAIASYELPLPNFVIADVGSSIYQVQEDQWLRVEDWDHEIGVDWQNLTSKDLISFFADIRECKLQEEKKQGLHKLSYYISLDAEINNLLIEIKSRLDNNQVKSNLIWSVDEEKNIGLLDILPQSANKYYAITHLMKRENFAIENTVFSGDSGNDLDVLISPIKSILVANAHNEVKETIRAEITNNKLTNTVYIAEGKYLNMNGNYSAGILEGIAYYFPEKMKTLIESHI